MSMADLERQLLTNDRLSNVISALQTLSQRGTNIHVLISTLRHTVSDAFFGCDVNVGVCPDTSTNKIDFFDDHAYTRSVHRGSSTMFECLDQEDIVVQAATVRSKPPSALNPLAIMETEQGAITVIDTVVHVPLIGRIGGIGVLEISGLYVQGLSTYKACERSPLMLEAMIDAKDYK